MSLINDALKKAQKMRAPDGAGTAGNDDLTAGSSLRRRPIPTGQWIVMIGGGAILLLIVSVGTTVFLLRPRFDAAKPVPTSASAPSNQVVATQPEPMPLLQLMPLPMPSADEEPASVAATTELPAFSSPEPAAPLRKDPAAKPDLRVQAFLDDIRVTGIRSSGADSKVLMNDRVYRVNDMVDRVLGVRLIEVQSETLTFEDENGVIYVKSF